MTDFRISKGRRTYRVIQSDLVGPTDTLLLENLRIADFPHVFLSVQWYDSGGSQGGDLVSLAYWTVEIATSNSEHYEDPPEDRIQINNLKTVDWSGPTIGIRVTPTDMPVDVVEWAVTVTANRT